jgi:hypothetical protein
MPVLGLAPCSRPVRKSAVVLQCLGTLEPRRIFRALRCVAGAVGVSAHAGELTLIHDQIFLTDFAALD